MVFIVKTNMKEGSDMVGEHLELKREIESLRREFSKEIERLKKEIEKLKINSKK